MKRSWASLCAFAVPHGAAAFVTVLITVPTHQVGIAIPSTLTVAAILMITATMFYGVGHWAQRRDFHVKKSAVFGAVLGVIVVPSSHAAIALASLAVLSFSAPLLSSAGHHSGSTTVTSEWSLVGSALPGICGILALAALYLAPNRVCLLLNKSEVARLSGFASTVQAFRSEHNRLPTQDELQSLAGSVAAPLLSVHGSGFELVFLGFDGPHVVYNSGGHWKCSFGW